MTEYLIDSHALLWWWTDADRLGSAARSVMDERRSIAVSAASIWEIAIKQQSGKLTIMEDFASVYRTLIDCNAFTSLSITMELAVQAAFLPGTHKDPFDRLIAAQALSDDLTVITRDPEIAAFGCRVLW